MSRFNQYRMMDILSNVDLSILEEEFPEIDLSNEDVLSMYSDETLTKELGLPSEEEVVVQRKKTVTKKIALLSSIAAGSIAVTGVIVYLCKKYDLLKKTA